MNTEDFKKEMAEIRSRNHVFTSDSFVNDFLYKFVEDDHFDEAKSELVGLLNAAVKDKGFIKGIILHDEEE